MNPKVSSHDDEGCYEENMNILVDVSFPSSPDEIRQFDLSAKSLADLPRVGGCFTTEGGKYTILRRRFRYECPVMTVTLVVTATRYKY